jgi:Txe/YoeB family toxin of Txe-Axe toxin-antitoxin module
MPFTVKLYDDAIWEYAWALEHRPDYAEKIEELVAAIEADPFKGIGKPEPLILSCVQLTLNALRQSF